MALPILDETEIRHRVLHITDLPPIPLSLQRLLEILLDDVSSSEELESIIGYDQALSAKVLRVANSSYYGSRGEVKTLSRAITLIGLNEVKSICSCALLMELFSKSQSLGDSERERLWKHSFVTARVAGGVAQNRPWTGTGEAYLLGLLHDLGRYAMALFFNDHYRAITHLSAKRKIPPWYTETHYGLHHTLVGKWLATRWAFPEVFQRVMEFHHIPERSPSFRPEVTLICLANILANSDEYPELLTDEFTVSYCQDLHITEEEWEAHGERLGPIRAEANQLWNVLK